jgi:ABC-2 type transport system ATP-binding protein
MLEVREVVKSYDGRAVVNRVSFEVQPGEIFALLGPNGAGKTTLIRMITDILRPDSGDILWEGRPARERSTLRVAYLPEERGLYRRTHVVDSIAYYGELKGMGSAEARAEAKRLLERVELGDWADKQVQALSKGMQQKVQICTVLIGGPKLLILDEPFTGLDPLNVLLLEGILQDVRSAGATVLLSTHQMNKVEELCDRALMINHGHMVLYGPVHDIRRQYADHAVLVHSHGQPPAVAGVRSVERLDGDYKLVLEPDATPTGVLHALLHAGVELDSFGVATLPLEDVFVKVVRDGLGLDHGRSESQAAPVAATGGAR